MAQIIAKFGYLKGKSRGGYAKYIATREGVEKLDESLRDRPVTQSQQEFINKLLEDFPDSKELWEYEDYKKSPTLAPPRSLSPQLSNSTWENFREGRVTSSTWEPVPGWKSRAAMACSPTPGNRFL